jgi:phosphatidylinositol-3-phosphatase
LLTNYDAISHPSEPNCFALYAGSTFGIKDDGRYDEPDPTLYTILHAAGKTFTGCVETSRTYSDYDYNPWESFAEGFNVEKDFNAFAASNFDNLPTVSFVIPNVTDDMHNGTIQQGDAWLQEHLNSYAQWAKNNNSLLIVTWDENGGTDDGNHVATILYGADLKIGTYAATYNHYDLLSTLLAASNRTDPRNAATSAPIDAFKTS